MNNKDQNHNMENHTELQSKQQHHLEGIQYTLDETDSSQTNYIFSVKIATSLFKEWAATQSMQGFRTGKVPLRLLKKDDFLKKILVDVLEKIKEDHNIEASIIHASNYLIQKFEFDADNIEVSLTIEKTPQLPETNFNKLKIKTFRTKITDDDINRTIKNYSILNAKAGAEVHRKSQNHDFLEVKLTVLNLKTQETESRNQEFRLGSKTFIDEIEKALVNQEQGFRYKHVINNLLEINIEILKIKEATALEEPDIRNLLNIKPEQSTQDFFKEQLEQEATITNKNLMLETIKKYILHLNFEVPLSAIQQEFKKIWNQTLSNLNYMKEFDLNEFIQSKMGISAKELESNITNLAAAQTKLRFMFYTLAKNEDIKITDHEIYDELRTHAKFFDNSIEKAKDFYAGNPTAKDDMLENLLFKKISDRLINIVQKDDPVEITLESLQKMTADSLECSVLENNQMPSPQLKGSQESSIAEETDNNNPSPPQKKSPKKTKSRTTPK